MKAEKTITICGNSVKMRYCAATETGYEQLSGNSIAIFSPIFGKDDDGNDVIVEDSKANMRDYLTLAISAIAAAYARDEEEAPIDSNDIMYDATPKEVSELIKVVAELRLQWYKVPTIIEPETEPSDESPNQ